MSADRLDLDAVAGEFLQQCGSCDAGLPMGCACPTRDYRGTMAALVDEVRDLRALLGSHADGHRCTCTVVREADYYGYFGPTPAEWEQDPWCPTHPDVDYISAMSRGAMARLAAVETLPDEWEGEADANETHPKECRTLLSAAAQLRAALNGNAL